MLFARGINTLIRLNSYVMENKKHKGMELRKLVSNLILENPKKYNAAFLGMNTQNYANWILNKDNWVRLFSRQVCNTFSNRVVQLKLAF